MREDIEFRFECSTRYFTSEPRRTSEILSWTPCCLLYEYFTNKKKSTLQNENALPLIHGAKQSEWRGSSWLAMTITHEKWSIFLVVEIPSEHSCLYNIFCFNHIEPKALFKMSLCNKPLIWSSLWYSMSSFSFFVSIMSQFISLTLFLWPV